MATFISTDTVMEGYAEWCPSMDSHGWSQQLWHSWLLWQSGVYTVVSIHKWPWMIHGILGPPSLPPLEILSTSHLLNREVLAGFHWGGDLRGFKILAEGVGNCEFHTFRRWLTDFH